MAGNANSGGRNRKSTQLHVLQGTFRKDRHGGGDTPDPPPGRPKPPRPLSAIAKAEWERMIERLEATRALSIVDDAVLYQYVCLFSEVEEVNGETARLRRLSKELKTVAADKLEGDQLVDAIGHIVKLQLLIGSRQKELRQGHMALRTYLIEFGLTPCARTRVKLPGSAATGGEDKKPRSKFLA